MGFTKFKSRSLRRIFLMDLLVSVLVSARRRFSTAALGGGSVFPLVVVTLCHCLLES